MYSLPLKLHYSSTALRTNKTLFTFALFWAFLPSISRFKPADNFKIALITQPPLSSLSNAFYEGYRSEFASSHRTRA
jgi:hypothetical protein